MKTLIGDVVLKNIDFKLLKKQKLDLLEIYLDPQLTDSQYSTIEGVVNLIDAIQDYAVDNLGYDEQKVFNLIINSKVSRK